MSPDSVGKLLLEVELQTAFPGALYGIDPDDQRGVEAGKIAAFALIGREGYAEHRQAIEAAQPPEWTI